MCCLMSRGIWRLSTLGWVNRQKITLRKVSVAVRRIYRLKCWRKMVSERSVTSSVSVLSSTKCLLANPHSIRKISSNFTTILPTRNSSSPKSFLKGRGAYCRDFWGRILNRDWEVRDLTRSRVINFSRVSTGRRYWGSNVHLQGG